MKLGKIIIIILIIAAFGAGIYFKDDAIKFYNSFGKQVIDFQKTRVAQTISQVSKEILSPLPLNVGGTDTNAILLQSKTISETNLQRQENGNLPALIENKRLDEAASAKANDILKNQYFEHVSPSGVDPGKLVQSFGYDYVVAGENLILGNFSSEKEVVQDWMNSPGHRANILNNRYTNIGVAIVKGTYKGDVAWVGVQEFGLPLSECNEPDSALKVQIDSENTQLDNLSSQIDAQKKEIGSADQSSAAYGQMVDDYNKLVSQYDSLAVQEKQNVSKYNLQADEFNNCVAGK